MKAHTFKARLRAFRIWQKLGYNPWKKPVSAERRKGGDFYKGAFDSIPFLNEDAKRTFTHLLLRPGYMIRDYIKGQHNRYLAPLTALIVFYAFYALVSAVLQPVQHREQVEKPDPADVVVNADMIDSRGVVVVQNFFYILRQGYYYLNLDKYPELVDTRAKGAIAALEGTLRSQGIPLFLSEFLLLWIAMWLSLRRRGIRMSAAAAGSAYVLCQFSFFMLFAVLLTWGESKSVSLLLMLALLAVDYYQWMDLGWGKSIRLAIRTGIMYGLLFGVVLILVSLIALLFAWNKTA